MEFTIDKLLSYAAEQGASDLHISANNPPILRISGSLIKLQVPPLTPGATEEMIYALMNEEQQSYYKENLEIDFSASLMNSHRCRVNAFHTYNGCSTTIRLIPTQIKSAQELGLPEIVKGLSQLHKGLVLITGPTCSGKSTTMAAIINEINRVRDVHIITIEDPIEFIHQSNQSLISHREVGQHTKSFSNALRSALREDPDIIFVGEMRDLETIQLALTAAETGHLVFGTLHTNSAAATMDRVIDVFPSDDKEIVRVMVANSIVAVVSQALLKRSDGRGMIAAHEILVATPAVKNLIRENKTAQINSLMQVGGNLGMKVMRDVVFELEKQGIITREEAKRAIQDSNITPKTKKRRDRGRENCISCRK